MKKKRLTLALVLVCALLLGIAGTVYATGYTYGQYNMTYLPGTTDTRPTCPRTKRVSRRAATIRIRSPPLSRCAKALSSSTGRSPGELWKATGPDGLCVVKYLDKDTNEPVADEKTESGLEVGTSVTETAIPVDGYTAVDPTEATLILAETGNEIIFYYERQPVLTDYVEVSGQGYQ